MPPRSSSYLGLPNGKVSGRDVRRGEYEQDAPNQPNRGSSEIRDAPNPVMSSHGVVLHSQQPRWWVAPTMPAGCDEHHTTVDF